MIRLLIRVPIPSGCFVTMRAKRRGLRPMGLR